MVGTIISTEVAVSLYRSETVLYHMGIFTVEEPSLPLISDEVVLIALPKCQAKLIVLCSLERREGDDPLAPTLVH